MLDTNPIKTLIDIAQPIEIIISLKVKVLLFT